MRDARSHLPQQRQPLAFGQVPFQPQLFFDQPAQIEGSGQLLAQKFQRRPRLTGNRGSVRLDMQNALDLPTVRNPKFPRIERQRRSRLAGRRVRPLRTLRDGQLQPYLPKFQPLPDLPLNEFHQPRHVALPGFLLNLRHRPLHPVHLQLRGFPQSPSQYSLQRLDKNHEYEQQNRRGSFRRKDGLQPNAHTADQTQVQQSQKRCRYGIDKVLLPPDLQKIVSLHQIDERDRGNHRNQRKSETEALLHG